MKKDDLTKFKLHYKKYREEAPANYYLEEEEISRGWKEYVVDMVAEQWEGEITKPYNPDEPQETEEEIKASMKKEDEELERRISEVKKRMVGLEITEVIDILIKDYGVTFEGESRYIDDEVLQYKEHEGVSKIIILMNEVKKTISPMESVIFERNLKEYMYQTNDNLENDELYSLQNNKVGLIYRLAEYQKDGQVGLEDKLKSLIKEIELAKMLKMEIAIKEGNLEGSEVVKYKRLKEIMKSGIENLYKNVGQGDGREPS